MANSTDAIYPSDSYVSYTGSVKADVPGEVSHAIERLRTLVDSAGKSLLDLSDRLAPVCRPTTPDPVSDVSTKVRSGVSVADEIQDLADRVQDIDHCLDILACRIAL